MISKRHAPPALWLLLTILSLPLSSHGAGASSPRRQPNVLFITIDDLRPELESFGIPEIHTPNISRLASKGLQFDAAYCQYPVCNPSRASFLTGQRPDELGIHSNRVALRLKWPNLVTLPQHFRNLGYFTAGLGKLFHLGTDSEGNTTLFRDDLSFDHSFKAKGREPQIGKKGLGRRLGDGTVRWAQWRAAEGGDLAQADGLLAAEAVRVLEKHHTEPFFLAVGFHKPHDPFVAPKEYFEAYPLHEVQLNTDPKNRSPSSPYALPKAYNFNTFTDQDRREFQRAYYACTSFVDAQVGKLLATLDRLELWKNTIVVLLGDHGYHLGEHGWWNKVTVFDIGARVPLILWAPKAPAMGARTAAVVELLDLFPTLVDLCGLKAPHALSGKSWRPILENPRTPWAHPAYTQVIRGGIGMGYSVRKGNWRLTQWGHDAPHSIELYNVERDKEGFHNLALDPAQQHRRDHLLRILKAGFPQLKATSPAR